MMNKNHMETRKYNSLKEVFETAAYEVGEEKAIVSNSGCLTYATLNKKANTIAYDLLARGVGSNSIVAIQMPRSIELLIALVAVIKTGAAYMPIAIDCPKERRRYIIDNSGAKVLLMKSGEQYAKCEGLHYIGIQAENIELTDANPVSTVTSEELAYIIYTSGSTGMPKGAMIEQGAILNRLFWMKDACNLTAQDRIIQKTPYTFDVSVWELFLSFFTRGTLYLLDAGKENDVQCIVDFIMRHRITMCHFIPSMFAIFLKYVEINNLFDDIRSLRTICCSGESLPYNLVTQYQETLMKRFGTRLFNLYGPTEAAVDVTSFECTHWKSPDCVVPIGYPIANTKIYILDENQQLCAVNQEGELYISGKNVGRGYINRPDITAERFMKDPFDVGQRMFRTGDIAKYNEMGQLIFLGRIDNQIKVRGMRIEPEEIELIIKQNLNLAKVIAGGLPNRMDEHNTILCAVYESDRHISDENFVLALEGKLPPYMIPDIYMRIDKMPLLSNGKIDRKEALASFIVEVGDKMPIAEKDKLCSDILAVIKEQLHPSVANNVQMSKSLQAVGIDSLSYMTIVVALEDTYNIRFDNMMLSYSLTKDVSTLVSYVISRIIDRKQGEVS